MFALLYVYLQEDWNIFHQSFTPLDAYFPVDSMYHLSSNLYTVLCTFQDIVQNANIQHDSLYHTPWIIFTIVCIFPVKFNSIIFFRSFTPLYTYFPRDTIFSNILSYPMHILVYDTKCWEYLLWHLSSFAEKLQKKSCKQKEKHIAQIPSVQKTLHFFWRLEKRRIGAYWQRKKNGSRKTNESSWLKYTNPSLSDRS